MIWMGLLGYGFSWTSLFPFHTPPDKKGLHSPPKRALEDEKSKKLMKDNKREMVMWESEEAAKKVQMASEAYGAFRRKGKDFGHLRRMPG